MGLGSGEFLMVLKFLIVVLLLGLVVSLFSGFYYLMVDQGDKNKRRTLHSLGVRVSLAAGLISLIIYGVATGQIRSQAPWEKPRPVQAEPSAPQTKPQAPLPTPAIPEE